VADVTRELTTEEIEAVVAWRAAFRDGVARKIREATEPPTTQSEVAKEAGCHWTTISKAERGERVPRAELTLRLADVYARLVDVALGSAA
jgi:DNA-binding XRE family transcriptional regulator